MTKQCKFCGKEIITTNSKKIFCNDKCKNDYGNNKRKEADRNKRHYCIVCNKVIKNYTPNTKFCCDKCHNTHLINKNNEKYEGKESVTCAICGWKAKALTQHLSDRHSITLHDYMKKYNKSIDECILKTSRELWGSKIKGENNGAYGHGGKYSPYSKKFVKYEDLTDEEKEHKINSLYDHLAETLTDGTGRLPTQVEYWTKQGYTEEESLQLIKERQTTFSLEKCIERYGEEEGIKRWQERQKKWLDNYKHQNYSAISQRLFWQIYEKIKDKYNDIYFAEINGKEQNNEYVLKLNKSYCKLDFFVKDINKAIEFDGDYWHGEARGNQERDRLRDTEITNMGISLLHIRERDYKTSPNVVITECIKFLTK